MSMKKEKNDNKQQQDQKKTWYFAGMTCETVQPENDYDSFWYRGLQ